MNDREKRLRELASFFERGTEVPFQRGEAIFTPHMQQRYAFYIREGYIKVYAPTKYGYQNLLCILGAGDVLPLPGAFGVYTVESFYIAMSDAQLLRLKSSTLSLAIQENTILSQAIMWQLYDLLMNYSNRVNTLSLRTHRERIASLLVLLVARFGIHQDSEEIINLPITHQEIAESVSATRESVSRIIIAFCNEGALQQRNHLLVVKDMRKLMAELE